MKKKKRKRSAAAADVRTPKYKMRIVPDKKKKDNKTKCRKKPSWQI